MRRTALLLLVLAPAFAGCVDSAGGPAATSTAAGAGGADGGASVAVLVNLTTPYAAGPAYGRELAGVVPPGSFPSPGDFCCWFAAVPAEEAFPASPSIVHMRVTVAWTNTAENHADLDFAACVPHFCGFRTGGDQTAAMGEHSETHTFVTGRFDWWEMGYELGVRYRNAVVTSGLPFTVSVEAVPLERALDADAYPVEVPEGANLTAEILAPLGEGRVSLTALAFDEDGRPLRALPLEGTHGERVRVDLGPGRYVIVVYWFDGGTARLSVDRPVARESLVPPPIVHEETVLVEVPERTAGDGALEWDAPPGTAYVWAWFRYDEGAHLQPPGLAEGQRVTIESSSGAVTAMSSQRLGARAADANLCLSCNGRGEAEPANFVDDDGTYTVRWSSDGGATGRFMMFTGRYDPQAAHPDA